MRIEVEITNIQYGECGKALDCESDTDYMDRITVKVTPCPDCLEKARDEGREEESE